MTVTATFAGFVMVRDPGVPVIDPDEPLSSASTRFVSCSDDEPLALAEIVALIVATTPLPMGVVFSPARMQVDPLHDKLFPAADAAGPG